MTSIEFGVLITEYWYIVLFAIVTWAIAKDKLFG